MSLRSEVLDCMPIGVEMITPEIAYKVRPNDSESQHRITTSRVYNALSILTKWEDVKLVGKIKTGKQNSEVAVWVRVR